MLESSALAEFEALLQEELHERKYNRLAYMWPSDGPYGRIHYPKHMELIAASAKYHELGMMGGNGAGKSMLGAAFTAILATGRYPEWWSGYVVNGPVRWWVTGITKTEVRTSTQKYLIGDVAEKGDEYLGTGLIPREDIVDVRYIQGSNKACDFITVKNRAGAGGLSTIRFKSYDQGADTFQADNLHGAWCDEEPPLAIYSEIMQRFRAETRDGRVLTTFTPLKGMTAFASMMLDWREANEKEKASRFSVMVGQREVPHLTEEEINRRLAAAPANERVAREKGMPYVGAGLIYPVAEDQFVLQPKDAKLGDHMRRAFALDYGWHNTAVLWGAYDEDVDTLYVYSEYKDGELPIDVHATRMKARGSWIPGIGDSSVRESDGKQVITKYRQAGVRMKLPNKAAGSVGTGIDEVLSRLSSGRLKILSTCVKTLEEIRKYRREVKETEFGTRVEIVKKDDHLMDCLRYLVVDGIKIATTQQRVELEVEQVRFA